MKLNQCRICDNKGLTEIIDLGEMALANEFIDDVDDEETQYPLRLVWCSECYLVQIDEIVPPDELFSEYIYVSGTSERLQNHFDELAANITNRYPITTDGSVVDIGSNDGTLLSRFQKRDLDVLGVEPATNIAELANKKGIETINEFFSSDVSTKIVDSYNLFELVTATNVFAHTHNVQDFVQGVYELLTDEGIFVIEVPYLIDLLEGTEFDTIYHEHLSYFAVHPLKKLFEDHNMRILNVERKNIHGGSIRLEVAKEGSSHSPKETVEEIILFEKEWGLDTFDSYQTFAENIHRLKSELVELLEQLKDEGNSIAGYGAAAKGNTLLNYYDIGTETIEFIADKNELKQGKYTPGSNIPVVAPDHIYEADPDYILILAWNFSEEIISQQEEFKEEGGKFIIPIPEVKIR
jgi:SAM-dependent methyltransferase